MGPTGGSIVDGCTSEPLSFLTELSILKSLATDRVLLRICETFVTFKLEISVSVI